MYKKISFLLSTIVVLAVFSQSSLGFVNPLKSYNLYEDTHTENSPTDNVMSEMFYTKDSSKHARSVQKSSQTTQSSVSPQVPSAAPPTSSLTPVQNTEEVTVEKPQRRNDYLRESSKKVYATGSGGWTQGPYFYPNPTLKAIRWKYHISNFAGCLQECEAYIQKHPSDTLGYYYLAMSYAKCGDKDNAIRAYEKVIALNDNPMIVKYATNGRNCVMGNENEAKCFQDVNVPELLYPYRNIAQSADLTPVDPQTLINRNITQLQQKLNPPVINNNNGENSEQNGQNNNGNKQFNMPFQTQDDQLDKFIKAPYGSGMAPDLEKEYKQQQLKNIQQQINNNDENSPGKYFQNIRYIKGFDKKSEAADGIKLALANDNDVQSLLQNPEYIKNKKELDELKMMLGTSDSTTDVTTMLPEIAKDGGNISPEVIQMMMMQSVMPDIIDIDAKNGF